MKRLATGIALLLLAGCSQGDNPTGPGGMGTGSSASIDGEYFAIIGGYPTDALSFRIENGAVVEVHEQDQLDLLHCYQKRDQHFTIKPPEQVQGGWFHVVARLGQTDTMTLDGVITQPGQAQGHLKMRVVDPSAGPCHYSWELDWSATRR